MSQARVPGLGSIGDLQFGQDVKVTEPEKACYTRLRAAFLRKFVYGCPDPARLAGRAYPSTATVPSPSTCEKAVSAASDAATRAPPVHVP